MKVHSAEFIKSGFEAAHWPDDGRAEIAFLGRSNVGKSSLINSLLNRRGLARTSNTPGRTQSINFFLINEAFYFVDLPGYGFAKVSKKLRGDWGMMAEDYLAGRKQLVLAIQLVDSRHEPKETDRQLAEWLEFDQVPTLIVATKSDKLSAAELKRNVKRIETELGGSTAVAYSSVTGRGRQQVWDALSAALNKFRKM